MNATYSNISRCPAWHFLPAVHVHTDTLCDSTDKCLAILQAIQHPNVCLLFDPIHLFLAGEQDLAGSIARLGPYIELVNLQNFRPAVTETVGSLRVGGKIWIPAPPGHPQGLDFQSTLAALRRAGYDGWLNVMCSTAETEDPAAVASLYREHLLPLANETTVPIHVQPPPPEFLWLQNEARTGLAAARFVFREELTAYYPAAGGEAYPNCYLRDFTYMVEAAPEFIPAAETRALLALFLAHCREDGTAPEQIKADGRPSYVCHGPLPAVDSGPFLVKLMAAYLEQEADLDFLRLHLPRLVKALAAVPTEPGTGLAWVDPAQPHTAYGFTDTIAKTGRELFSSLLLFEAWQSLRGFAGRLGDGAVAATAEESRSRLARSLDLLWSEPDGMYLAASVDCRQVDVWGSLYACVLGVADAARRQRIGGWCAANRERILFRNQVRHLPVPESWQRVTPGPGLEPLQRPGCFQNGAYWATASGWYAELLESMEPGTGLAFLIELACDFQAHSIWECIGPDGYSRVRNNLSSIMLPYKSFKSIMRGQPRKGE